MSTTFTRSTPAFLIPLLLLTGCKDDAVVKTYSVPKEARVAAHPATPAHPAHPAIPATPAATGATPATIPGSSAAMTATPQLAAQTAGFGTPQWTPPAGWTALPATSMRKGGWRTGTPNDPAEISVTVFPGDVGGMLANVRRWCGQIGMPGPNNAEELARFTRPAKVGAYEAVNVPLVHDGKAITTVVVAHDGATWFFKIAGSEAAVTAARPDFEAFLGSVTLP